MTIDKIINDRPPQDGRHWECQCARCGSSLEWVECEACGGEGITAPGELYEQDPLWYDPDDYEPCSQCGGEGHWPVCLSSGEYCEKHPRATYETVESGTPEWFTLDEAKDVLK